jgi:hypothetical protein
MLALCLELNGERLALYLEVSGEMPGCQDLVRATPFCFLPSRQPTRGLVLYTGPSVEANL